MLAATKLDFLMAICSAHVSCIAHIQLSIIRPCPQMLDLQSRLREGGQGEIDSVNARIEEGGEAQSSQEEEMKSKDADIKSLQAISAAISRDLP